MKKREIQRLGLWALVAVLLCGISFLPAFGRGRRPAVSRSALLNPSYRNQVTAISIGHGGELLSLYKKGQVWLCSDGEITAPASQAMVEGLLTHVANLRKMYKISDDNSKLFSGVDFFTLSFSGTAGKDGPKTPLENVRLYTKIDVFPSATLSGRILLRGGPKNTVYETQDDISAYCSVSFSRYGDESLFWGIDSPVSLSYTAAGSRPLRFSEGDDGFQELSSGLLSLRHGALLPLSRLPASEEAPLAVLVAEAASGRLHTMFIYEAGDAEDRTYLCRSLLSPSPADSGETAEALASFAVCSEISPWTFSRLQALFTSRSSK